MIVPTVGRVVWYHPNHDELAHIRALPAEGEPLAAHVASVNEGGTVNLMVIDAHGHPFSRTGVLLVQEGEKPPKGAYAEWMPYQKGQAAKADALEQKAKKSA